MSDWYDKNIEENVRDIVRLLRDNGVNTECSCHHQDPMYVQCQFIPDAQIKIIHDLVWNWLSEQNKPMNFEIQVHHKVIDGCAYSNLNLLLPRQN